MKILIVDNDADCIESMSELLKGDYEVQTALDEETALQIIDSTLFDLVIKGFRMAKMNRFELLKTVREKHHELETTIFTGFPDVDNDISAVNRQVWVFFHKPLDVEHLLKTIKQIEIKKKRVEKQNNLDYLSQAAGKLHTERRCMNLIGFAGTFSDRIT